MTKAQDLRYPVHVYPDVCTNGAFCYVAEHPDLPGCAAHGDTMGEAKLRLAEAREAYMAKLAEKGLEPPVPSNQASLELDSAVLDESAIAA